MTSVITPEERGRMGYDATLRRYGRAQMNRWRRRGGRKPSLTLGQITAGTGPQKRARSLRIQEETPITTSTRFS